MNAVQLKTLEWLVDGNGDITIGTMGAFSLRGNGV